MFHEFYEQFPFIKILPTKYLIKSLSKWIHAHTHTHAGTRTHTHTHKQTTIIYIYSYQRRGADYSLVTKGGKAVGIVMSVTVTTPHTDQPRRVQTIEIFLSLYRDIR